MYEEKIGLEFKHQDGLIENHIKITSITFCIVTIDDK